MDNEKVGKFIKEIRTKNNLTQKELADKYNVTYQAVSKWENGKNMPDISLIRQMSKDFNVKIEEILDGESLKNKKKKIIIILVFVILITVTGITICIVNYVNKNNSFKFKTITTNCSAFNVTGSIAYNNSKTSIYISNVEKCGDDDKEVYKNIKSSLYEISDDKKIKISDLKLQNNISLKDYLRDLKLNVDDYKKVCKNYKTNSLQLEIYGKLENGKKVKFKIPLRIKDNC